MAYDPFYETGIGNPPGWLVSDGGGGGAGWGGGGALPNPFIPTSFGQGGDAQGWGGMGPSAAWGGDGGGMRRRLPQGGARMAFSGGGSQMPMQGGGQMAMQRGGAQPMSGGSIWDRIRAYSQAQPAQGPQGPQGPQSQQALYSWLINSARTGGDPNYGGAFSLNGSEAIRQGMRGQMIQDAGARDRQARLGLQARGDTDPSTYGFQALMSQLGGQDQTAKGMNAADLGMKQQQMQEYWSMMRQLMGAQEGYQQGEQQGRWNAAAQPSGWGQALGGLGAIGGALRPGH